MDARCRNLAILLALVAAALLLGLASLRDSLVRISGDEGTYLAMAESFAEDLDLVFDDLDEERITQSAEAGRKTLILQRTGRGISYSKPLATAVVTAPFYAFFGRNGPIVANVLLVIGALTLLWLHLRRLDGGRGEAALTVVTFAATGALLPYVMWRTGDILQATLALAGLVLALGRERGDVDRTRTQVGLLDHPWGPIAGAVLLGVLISLRPPNALIVGIVPISLAVSRSWRPLVRFLLALGLALALVAAASWALLGTTMPYKAERATFNAETGYPAGADASRVVGQFERGRATSSLDATPDLYPRVSAFASLYFFVGRHTGVLIYFPATLLLLLSALRRPDRTGLVVIGAVVASSLFFLLWLPFNYFGGGSCIGNRYFLVSYAALPLALRRLPGRGGVALTWVLALLVGGSAVLSEWRVRGLDDSSQSHAHAGLFRALPYESTASDLENSRDRYFGKDFVRSVDPFVEARPWSFGFSSEQPPAEFVLANLERDERLRLLVHSAARNLEIAFEDYGGRQTVSLSRPFGERGVVELSPSRPIRHHPLWFRNLWDHGKPYWVRVFRLGVRAIDGSPVDAQVRFLGQEEFPPRLFERTVISVDLPMAAQAGAVTTVEVRVRNESRRTWRSDRLFPVYVSYRIASIDGEGRRPREAGRVALPEPVAPNGILSVPLDVTWPSEPGRYHVRVDMVAEGVAWFENVIGEPLRAGVVNVTGEAP
jgi:hypothetical protein